MDLFISQMCEIHAISHGSEELLRSAVTERSLHKGDVLIREGDLNQQIYFVESGLVRCYVVRDGKECTTWFSNPGEPVVMVMGSESHRYSLITAELLEDSVIISIDRSRLEGFFVESLDLCNWARRLADRYLCELESFLTYDIFSTAEERYDKLIAQYPELLQRVPLKYLASYLMMTPESLSRIRGKFKKK